MQQNKMQPMISVLMGIYYRREDTGLLHRSIRSILAQTYSNLEMIICDDGSTEAAQKVIQQYAGKDPRIHLVRNGNLITLPQKLNACLHQAKGEFLARMDDDDYARVDRLDKQMDFLLRHPNVSFVGSNVNLYCGGEAVGIRKLPENPVIQDFLLVQPFVHPTLLFRREALLAVGGYLEDKHCLLCEDYDLLFRLYEYGYRGANMQERLLDYTIPQTAKGGRRMSHRWNESVTRWRHFYKLGLMPGALPFVMKPLVVGLLPEKLLSAIKKRMIYSG